MDIDKFMFIEETIRTGVTQCSHRFSEGSLFIWEKNTITLRTFDN